MAGYWPTSHEKWSPCGTLFGRKSVLSVPSLDDLRSLTLRLAVPYNASMTLRVTLIQGGGMGFDQVPAVQRILEKAGVAITWDEHLAGQASVERGGAVVPEAMLASVRETGLALKTK